MDIGPAPRTGNLGPLHEISLRFFRLLLQFFHQTVFYICKLRRKRREFEVSGMKKVQITVMRMARYDDLIQRYENPIEHACDMREGQVFLADGWQKPEGFCDSAWDTLSPFVMTLACGGENIYDGWMKNKKSAMLSCNDGFRPVSFLLETIEEEEHN